MEEVEAVALLYNILYKAKHGQDSGHKLYTQSKIAKNRNQGISAVSKNHNLSLCGNR